MIVVAAPFFLERAWIPKRPGLRAVRIRPGAPSGFEGSLGRPDLLVSTGFCGGLDPRLKTGDLILASEVYHRGRRIAVDAGILARARAALGADRIDPAVGGLVTADRVVGTVDEKAKLWKETGAIGVEMEAGSLAAWAEENRVPFLALKAVLDRADRPLALRRAADAILHPLAAVRAGRVGFSTGRAIGRGIAALLDGFGGEG